MSFSPPPLNGLRVLEFAGLAPGPFASLLLADYGADVLRIDRASGSDHSSPPPAPDRLTRRKASIAVDLRSAAGLALLRRLLPHVDVVIDPYRPGVLEKLGLAPADMLRRNPGLIVARLTGFRRDGPYAAMAGHDINYLAASGALSLLGRRGEPPYAPANLLADFAGGGAMCALAILLALVARQRDGKGQVVGANMVDGVSALATFPRLARRHRVWDRPRGENLLDGGCPYYDTYATKDGGFVAVGALEPRFFRSLLDGLGVKEDELSGRREDRRTWPGLRALFERKFKEKSRAEWEKIFMGTDACCTPVLSLDEMEAAGYQQRPAVTLKRSPGRAIDERKAPTDDVEPAVRGQGNGVAGSGWSSSGLLPGEGGEDVLERWMGWKRGNQYEVDIQSGFGWKYKEKL